MRYVLVAVFVCVLGAPVASALPRVSADAVSASKADPIMQVAKRSQAQSRRQSRGASGIRPLVGSGDY
jgi:hypothetical protein